jgi:Fur family ferric uptake transcriptional regulator
VGEEPHHHLVCQLCGGESDLDARLLEGLGEEIRAATGFDPYLDHVAITGQCASCQERLVAAKGGVR